MQFFPDPSVIVNSAGADGLMLQEAFTELVLRNPPRGLRLDILLADEAFETAKFTISADVQVRATLTLPLFDDAAGKPPLPTPPPVRLQPSPSPSNRSGGSAVDFCFIDAATLVASNAAANADGVQSSAIDVEATPILFSNIDVPRHEQAVNELRAEFTLDAADLTSALCATAADFTRVGCSFALGLPTSERFNAKRDCKLADASKCSRITLVSDDNRSN